MSFEREGKKRKKLHIRGIDLRRTTKKKGTVEEMGNGHIGYASAWADI